MATSSKVRGKGAHGPDSPVSRSALFSQGLATKERRSPARPGSSPQAGRLARSSDPAHLSAPRPPREDPKTPTHRAGTRGPSPRPSLGIRAGGARLTGAGSAMGPRGPTRRPTGLPPSQAAGGLALRADPQARPPFSAFQADSFTAVPPISSFDGT